MTLHGESVILHPAAKFGGGLEVPGDKSISHRVAMLASLASGGSTVNGFLQSEDCMSTLGAMEALGARARFATGGVLTIAGTGGKLLQPVGPLDLGNSGTSMRLIAGLIAGHPITVELTGDESLRSRPMKRIKDPLEKMGAGVELLGEGGCAPVRIQGGRLQGLDYRLPVASAQVKSCILLAALFAEGTTSISEPAPSRDHTERLLASMGVPIRVDGLRVEIDGYGAKGPPLRGQSWSVPGDFSSAAFFMVAAAAKPGARLEIRRVGLNPRRTALLDVLRRMGAQVQVNEHPAVHGEPVGDVVIEGGTLAGVEVGGEQIPAIIDELPLVAVAGALAGGVTVIRDAAELRVKESDRIAVTAENLRLFGVRVEERDDGMIVQGGAKLAAPESVRSYGDHRIAMAMAVLALFAPGPVCIHNVGCVNTSNPDFWDDLRALGVHVE
ncbi:MAG: 3-phosphoshikimate 1-carboxyvinyltransferase [Kiritimatiellae bacterium]|nr:3-phosphoshikimate 1-carboxyvinyltransferase [Kiritimatiellia bacterium]